MKIIQRFINATQVPQLFNAVQADNFVVVVADPYGNTSAPVPVPRGLSVVSLCHSTGQAIFHKKLRMPFCFVQVPQLDISFLGHSDELRRERLDVQLGVGPPAELAGAGH